MVTLGSDCGWLDSVYIQNPILTLISKKDFNGTPLYVYPEDNSTSAEWWNGTFVHIFAISNTDGQTNTTTIVTAQGGGTYAAEICKDLNAYG